MGLDSNTPRQQKPPEELGTLNTPSPLEVRPRQRFKTILIAGAILILLVVLLALYALIRTN